MDLDSQIDIVGGSLTGPIAALLLQHAGFKNVNVFESTPQHVSQAGGVIRLDHTGVGVLSSIGISNRDYVTSRNEHIMRSLVNDGEEKSRHRYIWPGPYTSWTLLHEALSKKLPGIHQGRKVVNFGESPTGEARTTFADGTYRDSELVVFADGRNSIGRKILEPERPLKYSGFVGHRGQFDRLLFHISDVLAGGASHGRDRGSYAVFPLRVIGGKGLDWTFFLRHSADDYENLFGRNPLSRMFALPQHVSKEAWTHVNSKAKVLLPPKITDLVLNTSFRMAAAMVETEPPSRMIFPLRKANAILMGDALAPVFPQSGRGLNNGISQASKLVFSLLEHIHYGRPLDRALGELEASELPTVHNSIRFGNELVARNGLRD